MSALVGPRTLERDIGEAGLMGMPGRVWGKSRRRSGMWLLATWVLLCVGVTVGGLMLVEPAPAYARDMLGSECWVGAVGFTSERAVTLGPTEEQKRQMGYDWLPANVRPRGGLLVDQFFFHGVGGGAFLVNKEKKNRMAAEVKAEWGAESDADAVLDQLKVAQYEAGLGAKAGEGVVTKTQPGAAHLQDQVMGGQVTRDAVVITTTVTCGEHGCSESTSTSTMPLTETFDDVTVKLKHQGTPDPALAGEEGGPYTITEGNPENDQVKFTTHVDSFRGDGNARLESLSADRAVDTAGDVVRVTIELVAQHRQDFEYDGRVWPLFGNGRVGNVDGLWPKQSFLWDDVPNPDAFGGDRNGGVVEYISAKPAMPPMPAEPGRFEVHKNVAGLLTGGEIRWPVYLSDMAWYLYRVPHVPQEYYRAPDPEGLYNALVGDVNSGVVFKASTNLGDVIQPEHGITWNPEPERNDSVVDYSDAALDFNGTVIMPFSGVGDWPQGGASLVKAGVASPEDGEMDASNRGMNTFFQFDIVEHQAHGEMPRGGEAALGIGPQRHHWWNLTNAEEPWPNGELDPGETHVLVVTFYEGEMGDGEKLTLRDSDGERIGRIVTARYRRVVCRVVVPPLGVGFGSDSESGFWRRTVGLLESLVDMLTNLPTAIMSALGRSAVGGMNGVVSAAERAGCEAVGQLDGGEDGEAPVSLDEGDAASGQAGCELATAERTVTGCVYGVPGSCTDEYAPLVTVGPAELKRITGSDGQVPRLVDVYSLGRVLLHSNRDCDSFRGQSSGPDVCYGDALNPDLGFGSSAYIGGCPVGPCDTASAERWLPELTVSWEPSGGFDETDHDGYVVEVTLDPEAYDLGYHHDVGSGDYMPRLVIPSGKMFYVPRYLDDNTPGGGTVDIGKGGLKFGTGRDEPLVKDTNNLSGPDGTDLYDLQQYARERMVLADGFEHQIRVAVYHGSYENSGEEGIHVGPFSKPVVIGGNDEACDYLDPLVGKTPSQEDFWNALQCAQSPGVLAGLGAGGLTAVGDESLGRLQDFTGTEVCHDILTATPAHLTYELPAVRAGWKIAWIIAMALVPVLLFWEALRMSYGVWLGENQISGAVRSLAPRLLLGIVLASGSLLLCQFLILFCVQVTCYVGQATDVTLWGVIGWAFKGLFQSGWGLAAAGGGAAGGALGALSLGLGGGPVIGAAIGLALFMVLAVVFSVVLLLMLQMTVRILVIGVLTMLAPVAFIMVLSPTTSGWAWRWMSMMIGTLFMQVVTVMVLFLGVELARGWAGGGGGGFGAIVMSMMMAFVVFYVATKVPTIMNSMLGSMMTGVVTEVRRSVQAGAMVRMASQAGRFQRRTPSGGG